MLPKASSAVIYRPMPDGGVLFSTTDEVYFGLNTTGACIWENLAPVRSSVDEICAEMRQRFPDADPIRVEADVKQMLETFVKHRLAVAE